MLINEIEKLYENCNSEKAMGVGSPLTLHPFTAEKQIELIEWLTKKNLVVYNNLGGWHLGIAPTYDEELGMTCKVRATSIDSLKEALAELINYLWQDLTEEEKQQIKETLE